MHRLLWACLERRKRTGEQPVADSAAAGRPAEATPDVAPAAVLGAMEAAAAAGVEVASSDLIDLATHTTFTPRGVSGWPPRQVTSGRPPLPECGGQKCVCSAATEDYHAKSGKPLDKQRFLDARQL